MTAVRTGYLLFLSTLILLLGSLAVARASDRPGPRLDQEQNAGIYVGGPPSGPTDFDAQTFTAGITGTLESVQIRIGWNENPDPLRVQLRTVAQGVPTDFVLSTSIVRPTKRAARQPHWITVPLTGTSRAGSHYAIVINVLSTSDCDACWNWPFAVRRRHEDAYPRGGNYWYVGVYPHWNSGDDGKKVVDHPFRTYVTPGKMRGVTIPYQPLSAGLAADGAFDAAASDTQPTVVGTRRAGVLVFNSQQDWLRVRQRLAPVVGATLLDDFPFVTHSALIAYLEVPYSPPPASTFNGNELAWSDVSTLVWIKNISASAKGYLNVTLGAPGAACLPAAACVTPGYLAQAWVAVVLPRRFLRPLRRVHFTVATP